MSQCATTKKAAKAEKLAAKSAAKEAKQAALAAAKSAKAETKTLAKNAKQAAVAAAKSAKAEAKSLAKETKVQAKLDKKTAKATKRAGKKKSGSVVKTVLILGAVAAVGYVVYKKSQPQEDPWVTAAGEPHATQFSGAPGTEPNVDLTEEKSSTDGDHA